MTSLSQKSINNSLTRANSAEIAGFAMPGSKYDDFTWNANPNTQTAPANGYFFVDGLATISGSQYATASVNDKNGNFKYKMTNWYPQSQGFAFVLPVLAGDEVTFTIGPNLPQAIYYFRFIYAEGEK